MSIDALDLRPKPEGITKISKKAKMILAISGVSLVGIIGIGVSFDGKAKKTADSTIKNREIADGELSSTAQSLEAVFKTIPNSRIDVKQEPVLLTEKTDKTDKAVEKIDTKNVEIKLDQPTATTNKVNLAETKPTERVPSIEQLEADKIKQMKAQMKSQALMAPTKVGAVANDKAGLPPAIAGTMDVINNRLNSMMSQAQGSMAPGAVASALTQQQAQQQQDDQNKQLRKEQFLLSAQNNDLSKSNYLPSMKQMPLSKYEIKSGFVIPAVMLTGANSDLPGQLIAQVRENVYDSVAGDYLLIPQGSKLIGTYDSQVAYGQSRLLILWNRLIMPDGGSYNLGGMQGADTEGYAGIEDQVNNHYLKIYGSAMAMSVITAGVSLTQPKQQTTNGTPSTQETMAQALGQALGQTTNAILNKNINIQPTLEIRPGSKFNVVITKDMVFPKEYQFK